MYSLSQFIPLPRECLLCTRCQSKGCIRVRSSLQLLLMLHLLHARGAGLLLLQVLQLQLGLLQLVLQVDMLLLQHRILLLCLVSRCTHLVALLTQRVGCCRAVSQSWASTGDLQYIPLLHHHYPIPPFTHQTPLPWCVPRTRRALERIRPRPAIGIFILSRKFRASLFLRKRAFHSSAITFRLAIPKQFIFCNRGIRVAQFIRIN